MDPSIISTNSANSDRIILDPHTINNSESPSSNSSGSSTPKISRTSGYHLLPLTTCSFSSCRNNELKSTNELSLKMIRNQFNQYIVEKKETFSNPKNITDDSFSLNNYLPFILYKDTAVPIKEFKKKNYSVQVYDPQKNVKETQDSFFFSKESNFYPPQKLELFQDFQVINENFHPNTFNGYLVSTKEGKKIYFKALAIFSPKKNVFDFIIDKSNFLETKFDIQILTMDEYRIAIYREGCIEIINRSSLRLVYSTPLPENCKVQCCLKENICLLNFDKGRVVTQIDIENRRILFAKTFLYKMDNNSKFIDFEIFDLKISNEIKLDELLKQSKEFKRNGYIQAKTNIHMIDDQTLIGDAYYLIKNLFVDIEVKHKIKLQDITNEGLLLIRNKKYKYIEESQEKKFLVDEDEFEEKKIPIYHKYYAIINETEKKQFNLLNRDKNTIKIGAEEYSIDDKLEYLISSDSQKFRIEKIPYIILTDRYEIDSKKFKNNEEIIINKKTYKREIKLESPKELFIINRETESHELLSVNNEPKKIFPLVFLLENGKLMKKINEAFLTEPVYIEKDRIGLISQSKIGVFNYRTKEETYPPIPKDVNYNWMFKNNFLIYWFKNNSEQCCHIIDLENSNIKRVYFTEKNLKIIPAENSKNIVLCWAKTIVESEKSLTEVNSKEGNKNINLFKNRNYYLINLKNGKVFKIDKEQFKIPATIIPEDCYTNIAELAKDIIYKKESIYCSPPYIIQVGKTFGLIPSYGQYYKELYLRSFKYNHELVDEEENLSNK